MSSALISAEAAENSHKLVHVISLVNQSYASI